MCVRDAKLQTPIEGKTVRQKWRKGVTDVAGPWAIQVIMVQTAPVVMLCGEQRRSQDSNTSTHTQITHTHTHTEETERTSGYVPPA